MILKKFNGQAWPWELCGAPDEPLYGLRPLFGLFDEIEAEAEKLRRGPSETYEEWYDRVRPSCSP